MSGLFKWLASIVAAIGSLFAIKKHIERAAIAREHRKLNKAVRVVEAQLAKTDREIDAAAAEKIKTLQKATAEVLSKSKITGTDANALIKKVKGKNS